MCASCNTYEGGGYRFIHRPGAVPHLLLCDGCRRDRTVPPRHQPDIVLQTFVPDLHGPCAKQSYSAWGVIQEDGSIRFRMRCWQCTSTPEWEQVVPAAHVRQLVREFVDKALEVGTDDPGQESA
ncbi:hypothetical protein [Streptomyces sp. NPDC058466]|uniref:hypothetical protein n=1 Tax=Streptomyces sp. NPDC058466 TaxID=3346512 RepID=UPI003667647A